MIHSFLLFFFICNYVESKRRKSESAAGQVRVPRYAHASPWPTARHTASNAGPLAASDAPKPAPITTTLELKEYDLKPQHETPGFGISVHPKPETALPPAAALESTALAQAMSGLWDVEADLASPPRGHEEAISSQGDHSMGPMGRYV